MGAISQMPVILIPIHFDRDPIVKQPSCQRSVVIRTFITNDFMTGVPAQPEKHLPESVSHYYFKCKRVAAFRSIPLQSYNLFLYSITFADDFYLFLFLPILIKTQLSAKDLR